MEKNYAEVLMKLIERGMQPKQAVHALHEILARTGRSRLLPKIGRVFVRLAERARARSAIVLFVAREKDARTALTHAKATLFAMDAKRKDVRIQVDQTLVGGWRLEGREHLHDASWKKHLISIYNRSTQ